MNPLGDQAEAPKPKRGRGRPRGTKNSTKKASAQPQPLIFKVNTRVPVVVHPQSDLCNMGMGVRAGASNFHEKFASMPMAESVTNVTIQPGQSGSGHPVIYNYNYFWPSKDGGMLGVHPIPIPTQHNLEHRNENESQESRGLEQINNAETQTSHDQNLRRDSTSADVQQQEQNYEDLSSSSSPDMQGYINAMKAANLGVNSYMYQRFLNLVESYKLKKIADPVLMSHVKALFAGYPELADRFYSSHLPAEDIASVGYEEQQLSVGNTVTISNLGQQVLGNNDQSSATNLTEDIQDEIPEEVSTSQDASSVRYGSTEEVQPIHDNEVMIYRRAIHWICQLQCRFGNDSSEFKKVLEVLSALYEAKKQADKESGGGNSEKTRQVYEQRGIETFDLLNDLLEDQPDLLEEIRNHFTSEKTYTAFFRKGGGMTPLPMVVDNDVGACTLEKEINSTLRTQKQGSSQRRKSPLVVTLDDDEDEDPVGMTSLVENKNPELITLDEDEDTDQKLTILEVHEDTDQQMTKVWDEDTDPQLTDLVGDEDTDQQMIKVGDEDTDQQMTKVGDEDADQHMTKVGDEDTDQMVINLDEDEDQSEQDVAVIPNSYRTWSVEKPSDLPILYHCQERWVLEICSSLSPILIKIKSLRNFICNNLQVTFSRYDKDDSQSDEEETERKALATSETEDETMKTQVRGTYKMHPATFFHPKCTGRTSLCNEVLNNQYFTVAHRNKFLEITRNKEEERMDDYEDARFEADMLLHRSARTIQVMKELETKISEMSDEELEHFQLGNELGGTSIIHQHVVKLLYSKENEGMIIMGLQKCPVLFVPGVLKMLSVREREWSEFKSRWNDFISTDLMKFTAKYQRKKKFHSDRRTQKLKRLLLWQNAGRVGK